MDGSTSTVLSLVYFSKQRQFPAARGEINNNNNNNNDNIIMTIMIIIVKKSMKGGTIKQTYNVSTSPLLAISLSIVFVKVLS